MPRYDYKCTSCEQEFELVQTFAEAGSLDLLLIPGGRGTRKEVGNERLIDWLTSRAEKAEIVASVCTGSAVLAAAGRPRRRRPRARAASRSGAASGRAPGHLPPDQHDLRRHRRLAFAQIIVVFRVQV